MSPRRLVGRATRPIMKRDIDDTIAQRLSLIKQVVENQAVNIGSLVGGTLLSVVLYTQTALAQEGIESAAAEICVDRVASLASLAYYAVALASILKGLYILESPSEGDQSRKEQRSTRSKGLKYIGIGLLAGVIPPIMAAAGIIDVTSCIAPEHVGG